MCVNWIITMKLLITLIGIAFWLAIGDRIDVEPGILVLCAVIRFCLEK